MAKKGPPIVIRGRFLGSLSTGFNKVTIKSWLREGGQSLGDMSPRMSAFYVLPYDIYKVYVHRIYTQCTLRIRTVSGNLTTWAMQN